MGGRDSGTGQKVKLDAFQVPSILRNLSLVQDDGLIIKL